MQFHPAGREGRAPNVLHTRELHSVRRSRDMDTAQAGADLEEQEDDVFEIVDYTAASTWEKLINALEGAIHSWGLNDGGRGDVDKMEEDGTTARKEVLFLDDVPYVFRYLFLPIEDSDVELKDCEEDETQNDFVPIRLPGFSASTPDNPTTSNPLRHPYHDSEFSTSSLPHALHRYVGLSRILTLTPFDEDSDTPKSPSWGGAPFTLAEVSRTKKLLSSLTIALRNSGCLLPGFVRTGPRWKNLYDGVMISRSSSTSGGESNVGDELDLPRRLSGLRKVIEESPSYRVHFRMGHLSYMPREMDDVRGMVGLFMERLCGVETPYATPDADDSWCAKRTCTTSHDDISMLYVPHPPCRSQYGILFTTTSRDTFVGSFGLYPCACILSGSSSTF
ncbi:hypothetical protein M427DRAFT_400264 [Gonapodya prolifera JEL478]|uniref:Rab3 GTPase-activating protein catalytic subunit n=1 Tax=Gonapodya prolifera (strain JEL478) TaxID=1344416 RepID=A0A139ATF8_GONPJ|nr:hypothetical protein M427DRAFT_400264 [Gonapodya prolifera JEL478]|eukprot:KXS20017.1 hypothetical protein M427DRAFT_400264 [Gonapodya prolifera JEL478]